MSVAPPISKSRLEALSDGVYAVALTLLALDLKLPPLVAAGEHLSNAALRDMLVLLAPKALIWLLSFWVGALFWLAQNRMLQHYRALDKPALLVELFQLALVTLLPFSTALISEHGNLTLAAAVYSSHLVLLALLSLARVRRIQRREPLRDAQFDAGAVQLQWHRDCVLLGWLLLALALAFVVPGWNMLAVLGVTLRRLPGGKGRDARGA